MTVSQERFIARHHALWSQLEADLTALAAPGGRARVSSADFPARYRRVCQHLALARARLYSPALIHRLSQIVARGHHQLYGPRPVLDRFRVGIWRTFPRAVRAEWRLVLLSALLFYGSGGLMFAAVQWDPVWVYSVLDGASLANIEAMYDPSSSHFLREREASSDILMFGFYVRNNTGIGLRTFAGGLLAGLGTVYFLVLNGVFIGATVGHILDVGYGHTLLPFVAGHSALELNAIVLSGAAGLRLGLAVLAPGRRPRGAAVSAAGQQALPIVLGMAVMFVLAAAVEAFWSPRHMVPVGIRYGVGAVCWLGLGAYLMGAGRGGRDAP